MSELRRWISEEAAKHGCEIIGYAETDHYVAADLRCLGSQRESFGCVRIGGDAILHTKKTKTLAELVRHETEAVAIATFATSDLDPGVPVISVGGTCPACSDSRVTSIKRDAWTFTCSRRGVDSAVTVHPLPVRFAWAIGPDNLFRVQERAKAAT